MDRSDAVLSLAPTVDAERRTLTFEQNLPSIHW